MKGVLFTGVLLLVLSLAPPAALAFSLPGRRPPSPAAPPLAQGRSSQQEVAPPLAVQQLQEALEGRRPRLEILSPADGALLPAGPWTLGLQVEDWPLVDAGPLGLGPHVVVQLDGDPPLPLTGTTTTMRPLESGSHRLTVYAARPWGEAVKSPGAQRQIRLHRVAANPLSQPTPGSPQLIAVSPQGTAASTPLLLDWLLLEAPLQNLRSGDASWRLRVSLNGDSFLVDQQTPLWLKGWRSGSNAIQLDLLDGLGEPLNPPFNSLVTEVTLQPGAEAPRWQGGRLEPAELAILLGEAPPPAASEPDPEPMPEEQPATAEESAPELETEALMGAEPDPETKLGSEDQAGGGNLAEIEAATADLAGPPEPPTTIELAEPPLDGSVAP
ncbi:MULTISPECIES: hypothetical protein [Synechococcales]|uniref:hypothetical protein n=1 Tax=Synechococcales TaxID=1890424 RepID=UPI0020CF2C25|nr:MULTISPECIES: hypothetical protein [Synechococcales]MCP9793543.1 hypothetical protein [Vulcanococcus limneticus MW73D5]MCP9834778.1 hypothetical protein [Cyanobium sp. La Preciosa 7G6]MCP9937598.1 hypothetical protein [Cyanobium sp. Aljojuca 7A6]